MKSKVFQLMLLICLVSIEYLATTTMQIKVIEHFWDKFNHFFAFLVLYILLSFAYKNLTLSLKVLILLGFGTQIEIVQHFIEGRESSTLDIFADSVGIFLGIMFEKVKTKVCKQTYK